MQLISALIISIAVAVIIFYTAGLLLQVRRTLASVRDFTVMLDSSVTPLLREARTLSFRINALSARIEKWGHTAVALKKSVCHVATAAEALGAVLALRNIATPGQSKVRMLLTAFDFLRRR